MSTPPPDNRHDGPLRYRPLRHLAHRPAGGAADRWPRRFFRAASAIGDDSETAEQTILSDTDPLVRSPISGQAEVTEKA